MKVEPINGEVMRFYVTSESNPEQRHLVDWLVPACGCASWTCRHRKHEQATGTPYLCKHLIAAREWSWAEMIETIKEQTLAQ